MNAKRMLVKKPSGETNWDAVNLMTEDDINAAAITDPDALPVTKETLKSFKRVNPTQEADVKLIRQKLHLSQDEFANYFGVSVRTLQEWEQHRRTPNATTRNFLKVIALEPRAVLRALKTRHQVIDKL